MSTLATTTLELLPRVRAGDALATERLFELLHGELRGLAVHVLRELPAGASLQATEVVHESYLRLASAGMKLDWQSRAHFLAVASKAMRQVLIDRARRRTSQKRGGGVRPITLDVDMPVAASQAMDVEALDGALERLREVDERAADVIVHRVFGGMSIDEIAEVLGVSRRTVDRSFRAGRAFLTRELSDASES